jgi:hypothetical protein
LYNNIQKYLIPDLGIYQKLPVFKINAWHKTLLVYNSCMSSNNTGLK